MAFCPYCGKQVADGEVCACTTLSTQQSNTGSAVNYSSFAGDPPPAPKAPAAEAPVQSVPSAPAAPIRDESFAAAASTQSEQSAAGESFAGGQSAFAPGQVAAPPRPAPEPGVYAPQQTSYAPQTSYVPPQVNYTPHPNYMPQQDGFVAQPAEKQPSAFVTALKELVDRAKKLLSSNADDALKDALKASDISWSVVYGAYTLLGTLAACFAIPKQVHKMTGGWFGYGDILGDMFGNVLWRSLLVNIFALGIALVTVMGVCAATKSKLSFGGVLNLVSMAFVPAVAFNALGLLFGFFFPVGTLLCGVISAVCTVVMLISALGIHTGRQGLWFKVITVSALILAYMLIAWLLMEDVTAGLMGGMLAGSLW